MCVGCCIDFIVFYITIVDIEPQIICITDFGFRYIYLYDAENGKILYVGDFKGNIYSGNGKLYKDGQLVYDGAFSNGVYNGIGTLMDETGIIYSGNFVNGKYNGIGKEYQNGVLVYSGEFTDSLYNGTGSLYRNGVLYYSGGFSMGKPIGTGTFYDESGAVAEVIDMVPGGTVLDVPVGQWHSLESLESGTVLMAVKDGPFVPLGPEDVMNKSL